MPDSERTTLLELARLFGRLGATAFGGPAAHVAMMRDEVVVRRRWLTDQALLDLISAANLIPGPNSTELALHIGWQRRGAIGLVVAGAAFILPAVAITILCGFAYVRFGNAPDFRWVLYGVKPAILGVMAQAIFGLTKSALKSRAMIALAVLALASAAFGVHELITLFGAGLAAAIFLGARPKPGAAAFGIGAGVGGGLGAAPASIASGAAAASSLAASPALAPLFWTFAKIGSVLYGSGYVLVAFLRRDFVDRLHWLTESQLIDAVAVGQTTPGPLFTTATFIGYQLQGLAGALAATGGIFLPAFLFVAISGPLVPRLRQSPAAAAFLDGVNVASLALMAWVTVGLAHAAVVDAPTLVLALLSALILIRVRPNATWLVLFGAAAGWAVHRMGWAR